MEPADRRTGNVSNQEKYTTGKPDFMDGLFLQGYSVVAKAVGKIRISGDRVSATGFRISKNLIMTCEHLGTISRDDVIIFHYVDLPYPDTPASTLARQADADNMFRLRPDILHYKSSALDFAVVAISDPNGNLTCPENENVIRSVRVLEKKQLADLELNILSYPEGKTLKASLRKTTVVEDPGKTLVVGNERRPVTEEIILHKADTEVGSSGAPIFDERWRLVGIHQGYEKVHVQSQEDESTEVFDANYGTLMKHILEEMFSKPDEELTEFERNYSACRQDLGIPFKGQSNKLKDLPGRAANIPDFSAHTNGGSTEQPLLPREEKHVLLLAKSWSWLKGSELSLITKRMAMEFAKYGAKVRVSCLVTETTMEEQTQAKEDGVHLYAIKRLRGSVFMPPENLRDSKVDIIIGCGQFGGEQGEFVKTQFQGSRWVHIACSSPEYEDEIKCCENADLTFAIGHGLASECERQLAYCRKTVRGFTPGVLKDFQMYVQSKEDRAGFKVLAFYPKELQSDDDEGLSIPAKAITTLSGRQCTLFAVCAPDGDPTELKKVLLKRHKIPSSQLIVRRGDSIEMRCRLFTEADLLILPFLPSQSESFGLIGLQAFSAGLPVLLNQECGLAIALRELPYGSSNIVNSSYSEDWGNRIQNMKEKSRGVRLAEAQALLQSYDKKYPWERQSREALEVIL